MKREEPTTKQQMEFSKYRELSVTEFAADPRKFGDYASHLALERPKSERLALLSVLLDHWVHVAQGNRERVLKVKELLALLLARGKLDGSTAQTIARWKYEHSVIKSMFLFALAYSTKKLAMAGHP